MQKLDSVLLTKHTSSRLLQTASRNLQPNTEELLRSHNIKVGRRCKAYNNPFSEAKPNAKIQEAISFGPKEAVFSVSPEPGNQVLQTDLEEKIVPVY